MCEPSLSRSAPPTSAIADADRLRLDIDDGILVAPRRGRVQYRLAEQGEVLPPGGRVLDVIDLTMEVLGGDMADARHRAAVCPRIAAGTGEYTVALSAVNRTFPTVEPGGEPSPEF